MTFRNLVAPAVVCLGIATASTQAAIDQSAVQKIAALAVPFVPNHGQWNAGAAFAAPLTAGTVFVGTDGRLVYALAGRVMEERTLVDGGQRESGVGLPGMPHVKRTASARRSAGWVLIETLIDRDGAALPVVPRGEQLHAGTVSYVLGKDAGRHRDNIGTYERLNLGEAYPGINLQLRATGNNVEKIFTVQPGRDPRGIRIRVDGADRLGIDPEGALLVYTGNGPVAFTAPIAYQVDGHGQRTEVGARYALHEPGGIYGFVLDPYDAELPLVIDPLLQSTYVGGNGEDQGNALAIHPATGDIYVAGATRSTDFPKVAGSDQTAHGADSNGYDAFVTRLNGALTTRLQSIYLGGDGSDFAYAVAIHPATGDVYVTGATTSTNFPGTAGSPQTAFGGGAGDAFVTRLNAALTTRVRSTYLGGTGFDSGAALAIHPGTGDVYVAGSTGSVNFPGTAGSEQPALGGGTSNAFVTRFNAALTTRLQSTYLGGTTADYANAMALHPWTGEVYVLGTTASTDFPKVTGGAQSVKAAGGLSGIDAFVTRLNPGLTTRLQSTYLGGTGDDQAYALAIHPLSGDVYVAGSTNSGDFPAVAGAEQTTKVAGGTSGNDVYVAHLNAGLTAILQSTYLGGNADDEGLAMAIHPATGEIYVAGYTSSTNLPKAAGGAQPAKGAITDGYVARLDAALTSRPQSTHLGSAGVDNALGLAIHPASGEVYVTGQTTSTAFPIVAGAEQTAKGASTDAFVSRFTFDLRGAAAVPAPFAFASLLGVPAGSLQISGPATISGLASSPQTAAIMGGNLAQFCISIMATCDCDVAPFGTAALPIANGQSVCVRQYAPATTPAAATAVVLVGGGKANFFVSTAPKGCSLDVDGNNAIDALTDGLLLLRAMFGLTGIAVTDGAIGAGANRPTWAQIQPYLNGNCDTNFAL